MMEVINKSDIYDYIHEGFSGNQILDMIVFNEIPTIKAIPLDKVKQVRDEIENLTPWDGLLIAYEVLGILDELIESEE